MDRLYAGRSNSSVATYVAQSVHSPIAIGRVKRTRDDRTHLEFNRMAQTSLRQILGSSAEPPHRRVLGNDRYADKDDDHSEWDISERDSSKSKVDESEHGEYDDEQDISERDSRESEVDNSEQEGEANILDYGSSMDEYKEQVHDDTNAVIQMISNDEEDDCAAYECKCLSV